MSLRSDLREMRHAQHLAALGQMAQVPPDQFRDPASDSAVDLVEHHHRKPSTCRDKNTKAHPRLLSARGGLRERRRRVAGIGADPELDLVDPGGPFLPGPVHRHRERTAVDPELAHAKCHLVGETPRGGAPALAETLGHLPVVRLDGGAPVLELPDPRLAGLEPLQLVAKSGEAAGQLVRRYPVLAPGVVEGGEPVLDGGDAGRVGVDAAGEGAHRHARLRHVHERRLEQLVNARRRPGRIPFDVGEPGEGAVYGQAGGAFPAREGVLDLVGRVPDLDGVGEAAQLRAKLGRFTLLRVERVQLVALKGEIVDTPFPLAALDGPGGLELGVDRVEAPVQLPDPGDELRVSGRRVEDPKLLRRPKEGVVRVLALQVHQAGAEIPQGPGRDRGIVDPGARAPVRSDPAPEDRFSAILEPELPAELRHLVEARRIEGGRDLGPLRTRTHHRAGRTAAEREAERVDEDGFSRAGLPGENGQPGAELHIEPVDDREVADCEVDQHGPTPDGGRARLA